MSTKSPFSKIIVYMKQGQSYIFNHNRSPHVAGKEKKSTKFELQNIYKQNMKKKLKKSTHSDYENCTDQFRTSVYRTSRWSHRLWSC